MHAVGGPLAAAVVSFNVTADDKGSIALRWTASVDQAIVGGLEVYQSEKDSLANVFKTAVPPVAAPSYSPLDHSTSDLQAAAPEPLLSTGQLGVLPGTGLMWPAFPTRNLFPVAAAHICLQQQASADLLEH